MKLLQLHEYLNLMSGSVKKVMPYSQVSESCHEYARFVWPTTGFLPFETIDRKVAYASMNESNGKYLLHVTGDRENVFLIVICGPTPEAHIVFDIGAEYQEIYLSSPTMAEMKAVSEKMIEDVIPRLPELNEPFAILDKAEGTYIQCYWQNGQYDLEHQLVNSSNHYATMFKCNCKEVITAFKFYAFGKYEWAYDHSWEKRKL